MLLSRKKSDKAKALERIAFFRALSLKDLSTIAEVAREKRYKAEETIISQGEPGESFYLVLEGTLSVIRNGETVAERGVGDFVGELSLISGEACNATVRTVSAARLLVIERRAFSALLDSVPGLTKRLLVGLAQRLRETDAQSVG